MSVPYAMVADSLSRPLTKLTVTGETADMEEALFEVKNKDGQTIFAIYNEGVRAYVSDGDAKGVKGGFAIGGFGTGKGPATPFTSLTPENYLIGHKSGSSIKNGLYNSFFGYEAGMNNTDGYSNIFIGYGTGHQNTTGGNNIIIGNGSGYHNQTGDLNVIIGNRAGYSGTNGYGNVFLGDSAGLGNTSDYNVLIGKSTGLYNEGKYNSFMGYEAGMRNTTGTYNVFLGFRAGRYNTTGSYNTLVGYQAGMASETKPLTGNNNVVLGYNSGANLRSGRDNVFIGYTAGYTASSGYENTFIGKEAGYLVTTGNSNVAIGYKAGRGITTSDRNSLIGESSGENLATGIGNAFFGTYSGRLTTSGDFNTLIGYDCGYQVTTGSCNTFVGFQSGRGWGANVIGDSSVFIGYLAGQYEYNSQRLYIENSYAGKNSALIYGEFDNDLLVFNADVGIGTSNPEGTLDVCKDFPVLSVRTSETSGTDAVVRIGGARTTSLTDDLSRIEFYNYESGGPFELARITARNADGTSGTSNGDMLFQVNNGSGLIQGMIISDNGRVGIGTSNPAWRFQVGETSNYGWVASNGSWGSSSDIRQKENIRILDSALNKVLEMNGIYFNVIGNNPVEDREVGFIAQEMEKILPEVVSVDSEGYKGISYSHITAYAS